MSTQAPARSLDAHAGEYPTLQLYIDGVWSGGSTGQEEEVYNPATGDVLGSVPHASIEDLDRALAAASRAFTEWRGMTAEARGVILHKAAAILRERADQIARGMTLEEGKPFPEARGEVMRVAKLLDWDAEEAKREYGRIIPFESDTELTVITEPVGPVAGFTPWNFPIGGPMRKLGAALSAGCSIILKPSEETPATAVALAHVFEDAGLPAGVLNVVFGVPAEISEHLIASSVIRMLAFTGSIPVGKLLAGLAAKQMKPSMMELGGHAPVIVCADANPELAAARTAQSKFTNAGQVCTSPSRIMVHESIYDRYLEELVKQTKAVKVGFGLDEGVKMGPLANPRRLQAATEFVQDAVSRGATVVTGGSQIDRPGWFFEPTVLTDVPLDAKIMSEEPFAPVAPVMPFSDLDQALELANSLPYGLAAYSFTESAATANKLKHSLEAGILSINHCGGSVPEAPSGGIKESGYGKEGGEEGLEGYLIKKRVSHKLA